MFKSKISCELKESYLFYSFIVFLFMKYFYSSLSASSSNQKFDIKFKRLGNYFKILIGYK